MANDEAAQFEKRVTDLERWRERSQIYADVGKWVAGLFGVSAAGAIAYLFSNVRQVEARTKDVAGEVDKAVQVARAEIGKEVAQASSTASAQIEQRARALGLIAVPVGSVISYAGPLDPAEVDDAVRKQQVATLRGELELDGWLLCDGSSRKAAEYPQLWAVLSGVDPSAILASPPRAGEEFILPDYRGQFLRGVDTAGHIDRGAAERMKEGRPSRAVGSSEPAALAAHRHKVGEQSEDVPKGSSSSTDKPSDYELKGAQRFFGEDGALQLFVTNGGQLKQLEKGTDKDDDFKVFVRTGAIYTDYAAVTPANAASETRPTNIAVHYLIKARR